MATEIISAERIDHTLKLRHRYARGTRGHCPRMGTG